MLWLTGSSEAMGLCPKYTLFTSKALPIPNFDFFGAFEGMSSNLLELQQITLAAHQQTMDSINACVWHMAKVAKVKEPTQRSNSSLFNPSI